jgi:ribosomal protein L44E
MKKYCPHCRTTTEHKRKVVQWIPLAFLAFGISYMGFTTTSGMLMFITGVGGAIGGVYLVVKGIAGRFKVRWECEICKNEN